MLLSKEGGRFPSLYVEDGETVTIGEKHEGLPRLHMRPRNTAALLLLAGRPRGNAPRLSDTNAFEEVSNPEALVRLSQADQNALVGGHSVAFLSGVFDALDPNEQLPPRSIKRWVSRSGAKGDGHCGCCHGKDGSSANLALQRPGIGSASVSEQELLLTHDIRQAYVPAFIHQLQIYEIFTCLGDIVIGRNATLILDPSLNFVLADNVIGYTNSRIVQRASYTCMDVGGRMRGGVVDFVHVVAGKYLQLDWAKLTAQLAAKL